MNDTHQTWKNEGIRIDDFIEVTMTSRRSSGQRRIEDEELRLICGQHLSTHRAEFWPSPGFY